MIRPIHDEVADLSKVSGFRHLKAGKFANCDVLAEKLDKLFPDHLAELFYAVPLSRKQIIAAVLSSPKIDMLGERTLRKNLVLSDEKYLLRLRFTGQTELTYEILHRMQPKCLRAPQYDCLHHLLTDSDQNFFKDLAKLRNIESSELVERLPECFADMHGV